LEDGLGDTVRVSLTEEPEKEAPVAIALVNRYAKRAQALASEPAREILQLNPQAATQPYEAAEVNAFIGGSLVPRVVVDISQKNLKDPFILKDVGYKYDALLDKYHMG